MKQDEENNTHLKNGCDFAEKKDMDDLLLYLFVEDEGAADDIHIPAEYKCSQPERECICIPQGRNGQEDVGDGHEHFVCRRIEKFAQPRLQIPGSGNEAIEKIGTAGNDENSQGRSRSFLQQKQEKNGNTQDSEQAEDIGGHPYIAAFFIFHMLLRFQPACGYLIRARMISRNLIASWPDTGMSGLKVLFEARVMMS